MLGTIAIYASLVSNKMYVCIAPKGSGKTTLIRKLNYENYESIELSDKYQAGKTDALLHVFLKDKKLREEFNKLVDTYITLFDGNEQKAKNKALMILSSKGLLSVDNLLIKADEINAIGTNAFEELVNVIDRKEWSLYGKGIYLNFKIKQDTRIFLGMQEVFVDQLSGTWYDNYASDRILPIFFINNLNYRVKLTEKRIKIPIFFMKLPEADQSEPSLEIKRKLKNLANKFVEYSVFRRYKLAYEMFNSLDQMTDLEASMIIKLLEALTVLSDIYYSSIHYEGFSASDKVIDVQYLKMLGYLYYPISSLVDIASERMNLTREEVLYLTRKKSNLQQQLVTLKKSKYFDVLDVRNGKYLIDYIIVPKDKLIDLLAFSIPSKVYKELHDLIDFSDLQEKIKEYNHKMLDILKDHELSLN